MCKKGKANFLLLDKIADIIDAHQLNTIKAMDD
jgi:hypothetical protein